MSKLFEKSIINGMELKNRFVRSATWERMAGDDGKCTPQLIELMAELAEGQVGLIISGHAFVRKDGQATPQQLGIHRDEHIESLSRMTDAVHERGGKILAQLAHSGAAAKKNLTGETALALSIPGNQSPDDIKEASEDDLRQLAIDFGIAAGRAREAGFDGVQLHGAHGYLLSQSISPFYNKRTDAYGGELKNRARLLIDVISAIREVVGKDYPVFNKMNSEDFLEGGLTLEESLEVAMKLQDAGLDAIEVSGGTIASGEQNPSRMKIDSEDKEAYFRDAAKLYKSNLDIPVILVGGVRSFKLMENLYDDGVADYFSMSRPFIREPNLIKRWKEGDLSKATCLSDNLCIRDMIMGKNFHCVIEQKKKDKKLKR